MLRKKKESKKEKTMCMKMKIWSVLKIACFLQKKKKNRQKGQILKVSIFSPVFFFGMFRTVEIINANIRRKYRFMKIKFLKILIFHFLEIFTHGYILNDKLWQVRKPTSCKCLVVVPVSAELFTVENCALLKHLSAFLFCSVFFFFFFFVCFLSVCSIVLY